MSESTTEKQARIVINKAHWEQRMTEVALPMEKDVAAAMGMSEVTLWRVRKGHAQPGTDFLRHAVQAMRLPNEAGHETLAYLFDNAI